MINTIMKKLMSANSVGASFINRILSQYSMVISYKAHSMPKHRVHQFIEFPENFGHRGCEFNY